MAMKQVQNHIVSHRTGNKQFAVNEMSFSTLARFIAMV